MTSQLLWLALVRNKSPGKTSHLLTATQSFRDNSNNCTDKPAAPSQYSHSQPATRDAREALKEDAKEVACKEAAHMKVEKELEEKLIMKYPGSYINDRIVQMKLEHYTEEAKSLRFFKGGGMAHTREVVAIVDWG